MKLPRRPYIATITLLAGGGFVFGQEVTITDPQGWFLNVDTVIAAGALLVGYLVNVLTSFGKAKWLTTGSRTVLLSAAFSVVIAGVGGYLAIGHFTDLGGAQGALRAAVAVAASFIFAKVKYAADKQVAESGAKSAAAKTKLLG